MREFTAAGGSADESLLTLADFLIVLCEVDYQPVDGSLPKPEFERVFWLFLAELADKFRQQIEPYRNRVSEDLIHFWERVLEKCRR